MDWSVAYFCDVIEMSCFIEVTWFRNKSDIFSNRIFRTQKKKNLWRSSCWTCYIESKVSRAKAFTRNLFLICPILILLVLTFMLQRWRQFKNFDPIESCRSNSFKLDSEPYDQLRSSSHMFLDRSLAKKKRATFKRPR